MTELTQPVDPGTATFSDLGVEQILCDAIADIGIVNPFPIQEITLPLALSGADVIGQARTGTGKTLAFGLPLLQRIDPGERKTVALVIVPTRELCLQVRDDLAQAASRKGIEVLAVYGGRSIEPQMDALRGGAPVVVGTPGRLLDLEQRRALDLSRVTSLVLDEADEMLDLGFLPDVERLIESTAAQRQTLLFSATMPSPVVALARRYMSKPTFLRADVEESRIAPATRQYFFSCHRMDKPAVLARILQAPERGLCVVFTRTKRMADILASELRDRGINAAPIHSDLRQESRERALKRFREGKIDVLVATEVAARGLDIDYVTHVVNYDTPDDEKMYLHRIGRTGRAGAAGVAITLAVWNELARVEMIKRALDIDEPTHEVFSTSDILDDLFDLPPRERRTAASAEDWDRAVGRGRRSSGSKTRTGRKERPEDAARGEPGAAAARPGRRRARSRTVQREDAGGGALPSQDEAVSAAEPGETATAGAAETAGRSRVRRRTRERGGTGGSEAASADRSGRVRRPSPGSGDERGGDPAAGERAPGGRGSRGRSPGEPGREGEASRGRRQSKLRGGTANRGAGSATPAQRDGRGGNRRRRSGGDANARRGRSDRSRSSRTPSRAGYGQVDAGKARGEGRPRLRRPLEVAHLP